MGKIIILLLVYLISKELIKGAKCEIFYKTDKAFLRNNKKHQTRSMSIEGGLEAQILTDGTASFILITNA